MKELKLRNLYIRIVDDKYHILKNTLEGYDNMCLLSKPDAGSQAVLLRYPAGFERELFSLLTDMSKTLKIA